MEVLDKMKIGISISAFWCKRVYHIPLLWGGGGEKLWVSIWANVPSSAKIRRLSRRDTFLEKMQKAWLEGESRKQLAVVLWWRRRPCDYAAITWNVYYCVRRWTSDRAQWTSRERNWRCCGKASVDSQCSAETLETMDVSDNHFYVVDHSMDWFLELQREMEALMWFLTRRYIKDMQEKGKISKINSFFVKYSILNSI